MIVDPKTYSESVNKNLHNSPQKTVTDFAVEQSKNMSPFGVAVESYTKPGVSENGNVNMSESTYQKPSKERHVIDDLMKDEATSAENHKNEMVVLSQTTTPEEYEKIEEEGFSITSSDSHTIVTVTDKIKAVMLQNGDTSMGELSKEQLEEITGSVAMAQKIVNLQDEAKAYLLKNNLTPTIENVYRATFSGQNMAKTPIADDAFSNMQEQLTKLIENTGLNVDNSTLEQCKWLITYQIPVSGENLSYLEDLETLSKKIADTGISEEEMTNKIMANLHNGSLAKDTMLIEGYSIDDIAKDIMDTIDQVTDEALALCVEDGKDLTVENLKLATKEVQQGKTVVVTDEARLATARRKLEEIRLTMTVEANKALLKRGIQIDIEPIEDLVKQLKDVEDQYYRRLLSSEGVEVTAQNVENFHQTISYVNELKDVPAYILDKFEASDSLEVIHAEGVVQKEAFQKASKEYEVLMTAPRKDLGDNIKKAFQNVDDILDDLGIEKSAANQKAVRILAYNESDITKENINRVKAVDEQVQQCFKNMTPKVTLEMIRKGMNPLEMPIQEMNEKAMEIKAEQGVDEAEKFSKYLYKLEQQKEITQAEKESYIGIYRLIAQVEKSDGAVIGSLMNQGADLSMKNLLSAVRSSKKHNMDYVVDDDFDGVNSTSKGPRIDDQIMAAYQKQCVNDALDAVTPQKVATLGEEKILDMTPEQLKEALEEIPEAQEEMDAEKEYASQQLAQLNEVLDAPEEIYSYLNRFDAAASVENVMASMRMMQDSNSLLANLFKQSEKNKDKVEWMKNEVLERFGDALKTPEELVKAQEALAEVAENAMKSMIIEDEQVSTLDMRELRLMSAGMKLCAKQAQEESYLVPVETSEGICGIAVHIVRDEDKKGMVDISFRGDLAGKIAAAFEAKEGRLSGTIAVSDETTRDQMSQNLGLLASIINENLPENQKESIDLQVALIPDLSLEKFQMKSSEKASTGDRNNQVQTTRLYNIAESFIETVQELMSDTLF